MSLSKKWSSETEIADHKFGFLSCYTKFLWTTQIKDMNYGRNAILIIVFTCEANTELSLPAIRNIDNRISVCRRNISGGFTWGRIGKPMLIRRK